MAPATLDRFDRDYNSLATPGSAEPPELRAHNEDAEQLVRDGIARRVPSDDVQNTTGYLDVFTVREDKPEGVRRRFIAWPRAQNTALYDEGYLPDPGLEAVGSYLGRARDECGAVADLKLGFFQVPLNPAASRASRFLDENGNVYELVRMPMGHAAAVDVMQAITRTLAGDVAAVKPSFAIKRVHVDTWVDGVRYSGPQKRVEQAINSLIAACEIANATLKEQPQIAKKYDFIGVQFDHESATVVCADKTLAKVFVPGETIRADDAERLVGRLIFASSVSRTPLGMFYFPLKWARRVVNKLNKTQIRPESTVTCPPSVRKDMTAWVNAVRKPYSVPSPLDVNDTGVVVFTDASMVGWGAVMQKQDGVCYITGGKWSEEDAEKHIGQLEVAAAANGLEAFAIHIPEGGKVTVRIDNTSVETALIRGIPRAVSILPDLLRATGIISKRNWNVEVGRVKSDDNPADAPSRGKYEAVHIPRILAAAKPIRSG